MGDIRLCLSLGLVLLTLEVMLRPTSSDTIVMPFLWRIIGGPQAASVLRVDGSLVEAREVREGCCVAQARETSPGKN